MNIVHLTASTFFGGPERQILGLAQSLPMHCRSMVLSFPEGGRCSDFVDQATRQNMDAVALTRDYPHLAAAVAETTAHLRRVRANVLCCHGYKADVVGRFAARRARIPAVAVSRGWTGEDARVRLYELLDRAHLRWMNHVVCVSEGQARKTQAAGVPQRRMTVIPNAVATERFASPDPVYRDRLQQLFPSPPKRIVGAAGRLSPEKGFEVLVEAAASLTHRNDSVGFVLFGEGTLRSELSRRIAAAGLTGNFILAGFRSDLDRFVPLLDLLVLPSFTEGMPNVVLEALAAAVPVVATAVGGTPEVIEDGKCGFLVPPGNAKALATAIQSALLSEERRHEMGRCGRERVTRHFAFAAQAQRYFQLFVDLTRAGGKRIDDRAFAAC
jgi:glycosyltransferase involved in cell wall biosynthesis